MPVNAAPEYSVMATSHGQKSSANLDAVIDFKADAPAGAEFVVLEVTVKDTAVRYTRDGSNPTTARGHRITDKDGPVRFALHEISALKVIKNSTDAANVDYHYEKRA